MGRPRVIKNISRSFDLSQGKLGDVGKSNYASTYVKHGSYRLRRPVPLERPQALVDTRGAAEFSLMDLQTTNMKTYMPHGLVSKRQMIRPTERELDHDQPFAMDTVYKAEYQRKSPLPASSVVFQKPMEDETKRSAKGKFSDKTTNKESFKEYRSIQPTQRFGELPTFTYSLIYPDKENTKDSLCTRTQFDYPYKTVKKPDLIKGAEPNIKVGEGDHHLETTQRACFKFVPSFPQVHSKSAKEPERRFSLPRMEVTTRYKSDYGKRERLPNRRKPAVPAPDTLDIKMDNWQRVVTEQREQFHGWDVEKHKRPDAAKLSDNTERSSDAMATETTMQHDFVAKYNELDRAIPAAKSTVELQPNKGKFRDMTTNKSFFLDWSAQRRLRHGDFHEAYNEAWNLIKSQHQVPQPLPKSTTHSVFVQKYGRPRTSMKPDHKTIDTSQENDFNTVTRVAYGYPPASAYVPEDFVVKC